LALATLVGHAQSAVVGLPSGSGDFNALSNKPAVPSGQLLYNQTGDTVASIEAACSSLCTYVVTVPQTITLAASHTLASNVQLDFRAGGKWTVNGAFTLTINGNVVGTLNQHFAGSSTVKFGPLESLVPVEWFGAVGDWNGTTGTDNTTAIQAALNSITAGQALLQEQLYKITSALSITTSAAGLRGTTQSGAFYVATPSGLVTTSASADILDLNGTNPAGVLEYNTIQNLVLMRSVAPTGTATGLSLNFVAGAVVENVQIMDSARGMYLHYVPSRGSGRIENCTVSWGYGSVTGYTGTLSGFYLDSSDGHPMFSFRGRHLEAASGLSLGSGTHGMDMQGTAIQDSNIYELETAQVDYGVYINHTGSTPYSSTDVHFYGSVLDGGRSGIYVNGATAATTGGIEFNGGYILSTSASGNQIDIEGSSGVSVIGMEIGPFSVGATNSLLLNNSPNNVISANRIRGVTNTGLALRGSSNNALGVNSITGSSGTGISLDQTSINNTGIYTNSIASTLTTAIANSGNNPLSLAGGVSGTPLSTIFNEGTVGNSINGTQPATDAPNSTWVQFNGTTTGWNFNTTSGAVASSGSVDQSSLIDTTSTDYTLTFTGVTNTATVLYIFRLATTNDYLALWTLGSGGVALKEAVSGTTTQVGTSAVANGATGNIVVVVSGNQITVTPFGGTPINYTIPNGHADLSGTSVGMYYSHGSGTITLAGVSVVTPAKPALVDGAFSLDPAGNMTALAYKTSTNCSSSASPAVCAAAASGSIAVAAAATTEVVNTTAVTANSQIQLTFDSSLGTKLGVTCNTTPVQPTVSARTAATSFTITVPSAPTTNPACFSYTVVN
jgi:hypothetical protein